MAYSGRSADSIRGRLIAITVELRAQPVACIQVLGLWQVSHQIGPLSDGLYRIEVSAGGLPWPEGAFQTATVTVAAAGGSGGLEVAHCPGDCNGDAVVSIDELTRGVGIVLGLDPFASANCPALDGAAIDGLIRAVAAALHGCPPPRVVDFSGFAELELFRGPGYGPLGSTMAASIRRQGDGTYLLKRSFLELGERGVDACVLESFLVDACYVSRVQPCRTLTAEEVDRVRAVAAAHTVLPGPVYGCGFEDPCLMTRVRWDDAVLGDDACSSLRMTDVDRERLVALLDSLGDGAEPPCPSGLCGPGGLRAVQRRQPGQRRRLRRRLQR